MPSELTGFAAPKATVLGLAQQKALGMFATAHSKEAEQVYSADPELGGLSLQIGVPVAPSHLTISNGFLNNGASVTRSSDCEQSGNVTGSGIEQMNCSFNLTRKPPKTDAQAFQVSLRETV